MRNKYPKTAAEPQEVLQDYFFLLLYFFNIKIFLFQYFITY